MHCVDGRFVTLQICARVFRRILFNILILKKSFLILTAGAAFPLAALQAEPAPAESAAAAFTLDSPATSNADLNGLREQVEALTKTVGNLQQQLDSQKQLWNGFNAPASAVLAPSSDNRLDEPNPDLQQLRNDVNELRTAQRQQRTGLFNPDISAAMDFVSSYSKAGNQWNFTLRDAEIMVQSNVDQYARAYLVFNAETELAPTEKLGLFENAHLGLEEAAIVTTSLPWGLQVKAGQFFADFTRLDKVHSHDLPFVDRPPSLDKIIGGEDVARGFEVNWVPPTSHYFRLTAGLVDNIGAESPVTSRLLTLDGEEEEAFADRVNRRFQSLMAYGRAATLVELGRGAVLHLGVDYAQSSQNTKRQIASADFKLEWQPDPAKYDRFEAGAETLWSRQSGNFSDAALDGLPASRNGTGTASAYGGYAYAQYRFGKLWEPGVRFDYTRSDTYELTGTEEDPGLARFNRNAWTYSAYLTLNLSEFNRLRLQLNYVNGNQELFPGKGDSDLQAFFQWTVILGAHKHDFMP